MLDGSTYQLETKLASSLNCKNIVERWRALPMMIQMKVATWNRSIYSGIRYMMPSRKQRTAQAARYSAQNAAA